MISLTFVVLRHLAKRRSQPRITPKWRQFSSLKKHIILPKIEDDHLLFEWQSGAHYTTTSQTHSLVFLFSCLTQTNPNSNPISSYLHQFSCDLRNEDNDSLDSLIFCHNFFYNAN